MPGSIHVFNPFNLQHGSNREWHTKLQEVIYYGESRFREAVGFISKAAPRHQLWMQECLHQELLFVMSYVGMATSCGIVVKVPLLLCSLADTFGMASDAAGGLPFTFDSTLKALLDAGTDYDEFGRVVSSYVLNWWEKSMRPAERSLLSASTLEHCLSHHREVLKTTWAGEPADPMEITTIPPIQDGSGGTPDIHSGGSLKIRAGGVTSSVAGGSIVSSCSQCSLSKALANDLLNELRGTLSLVSTMAEVARHDTTVDGRDAAGLFRIGHQVLLKEPSTPVPVPVVREDQPFKATLVRVFAQQAEEELRRLTALPAASDKWMWGTSLTKEEVLQLADEDTDEPGGSGYATSLRSGEFTGDWSATNTLSMGSATHSPLAPEAGVLPPFTHVEYPAHFQRGQATRTPSPPPPNTAQPQDADASGKHAASAGPSAGPSTSRAPAPSAEEVAHFLFTHLDIDINFTGPAQNVPAPTADDVATFLFEQASAIGGPATNPPTVPNVSTSATTADDVADFLFDNDGHSSAGLTSDAGGALPPSTLAVLQSPLHSGSHGPLLGPSADEVSAFLFESYDLDTTGMRHVTAGTPPTSQAAGIISPAHASAIGIIGPSVTTQPPRNSTVSTGRGPSYGSAATADDVADFLFHSDTLPVVSGGDDQAGDEPANDSDADAAGETDYDNDDENEPSDSEGVDDTEDDDVAYALEHGAPPSDFPMPESRYAPADFDFVPYEVFGERPADFDDDDDFEV